PDADRTIRTCGGDLPTRADPGYRQDITRRIGLRNLTVIGHIPDAHSAVGRSGTEPAAVRREAKAADERCMPGKVRNGLASCPIPQLDQTIGSARRQILAVGSAGDRTYSAAGGRCDIQLLTVAHPPPDFDFPVPTRSQETAIRAEAERIDHVTMS